MRRLSPLLLVLVSCSFQGTPVPVAGDTRILAGRWEGSYSSDQTGRVGSILFELKAGTDSAWGDVLMIPRGPDYARPVNFPEGMEPYRKAGRILTISFVKCENGAVNGQLDPYEDPDTGERVYTTFEGRLKGNSFGGGFSTFYPSTGRRVSGTWSVVRRDPTP